MTPRRGFTMIELMMVVGIIAVLIALLLPAVQAAREAARRMQCYNNLLQLGVALGNYASTHHVFPPGVVNDKGPISELPQGYHHGWTVQILPFLQQGNLYRRIDFRKGVYAAANETAFANTPNAFLCPSTRTLSVNFAGCHHDVEAPIDANNHGVLYLNSHVGYDDITDGPAYTILLGEVVGGTGTNWAAGTRTTLRNAGHGINETNWALPVSPIAAPPPPAPDDDAEEPDDAETMDPGGLTAQYFVGGFGSSHSLGANFLFCDGSARFLRESMNQIVLQRLGHRADGELISDDEY
jgi:prepilin-type N-terminal cleavage/methylation domain-containing protein/prepilin-type processing-associated H-X9-DG protein